jgi:hypothetical protein
MTRGAGNPLLVIAVVRVALVGGCSGAGYRGGGLSAGDPAAGGSGAGTRPR